VDEKRATVARAGQWDSGGAWPSSKRYLLSRLGDLPRRAGFLELT
jgi:hypothetical protein